MTGHSSPEPKITSFAGVKQGLDPKASYVIFEQDLKHQGQSMFHPSHGVYGFFKNENLAWQHVVDMDMAMEYLVIKVMPGKENIILGRILGYGFSKNIVFYIFKAEEV